MADEDDSNGGDGGDGRGDDDDGASKALRVAPAGTSRLAVARSLADAAPGEMVFVNPRGQALTRSQVTTAKTWYWTVVVTSGLAVGLVYGALLSPTAGVIAGIAMELLALFNWRHWPAFRTALAHVANAHWEEARAALLALEGKRLPPGQRQTVQVMLAAMEELLGEPQQAIERLERAQADLATWRGSGRVLRCQAASLRAAALSTLGRLDDARRARDQLVSEVGAATGASGRPRGDYLEMLLQSTELQIAANADTPDVLPDDETLHRWAIAALGRSRFGEILVSLAWAFHRRGDDDMARHLLAEAPSRIPRWSLPVTSPRLYAWAKERAEAWGIDLAVGER